jgi:hypothetical protein
VEEDVSRSEEVEKTRLGKKKPLVPTSTLGDSAGQMEMSREVEKGSRTTATGLAVMAGLYRPFELQRESAVSRMLT